MNFLIVVFVIFFIFPHQLLGARSEDVSSNRTFGYYPLDDIVGFIPSYPKFTKLNSYHDHPCSRKCVKGDNRECYYTFIIDYYETMSEACGDCPNNFNDCYNKHCVPADGRKTKMLTINYMFPSPIIEVCVGDTMIVDVKNLLQEETTLHWHGIHQKLSPPMDGAPYVSHYPIKPGESFRYRFLADNHGSLWYHSHYKFQRGFGLSGALIVRQPNSPNECTYDFDKREHTVFINDWVYDFNTDSPTNILINNKGRFQGINDTLVPFYSYFKVKKGYKYRFRMIFEAVFNCPVTVSVDNHEMLAIASDGRDFKPRVVGSIVILPGERWDFVLNSNKKRGCYWMRFRGAASCNNLFQSAILQYHGAKCLQPDEPLSFDYPIPGKQLNAVNAVPYSSNSTIAVLELKPLDKPEWDSKQVFKTYYLPIDFRNSPDGPAFTINHIRSVQNTLSLYLVKDFIDQDKYFCNATSLKEAGIDCETTLCQCIHRISIPKDEYAELLFTNSLGGTHPMHMHGYTFTVSTQGIFNSTSDIARVKELDEAGLIPRKRKRGPNKDVAQLMGRGWLGMRFKASNCGFWLSHCHIEDHADEGMHFTLKVCEDEDIYSYPKQLKCQ